MFHPYVPTVAVDCKVLDVAEQAVYTDCLNNLLYPQQGAVDKTFTVHEARSQADNAVKAFRKARNAALNKRKAQRNYDMTEAPCKS